MGESLPPGPRLVGPFSPAPQIPLQRAGPLARVEVVFRPMASWHKAMTAIFGTWGGPGPDPRRGAPAIEKLIVPAVILECR